MRRSAGHALLSAALWSAVLLRHVAAEKDKVPRTELKHRCSRTVSRNVRKSLEKEVLRPAKSESVDKWPAGCPFDPVHDLYGLHEKNKQRKRTGGGGSNPSWTCGLCGKVFKSEHYLDLHMENKHMNETPSAPVCLADYCEMFEVCFTESRVKRRENVCNNETLGRARKKCEGALSKCFPLGQEASRRMHARLSRHYCQVIDCGIREERRREPDEAIMPVIVLLILVVLICFVVFSVVVCCVDYSDDIFAFCLESGIMSAAWVKRLMKARETTRQAVGMDRTKCI